MRETRMELHWGRLMRCYVERPPPLDAMFKAAVAVDADVEAVGVVHSAQGRGCQRRPRF